jgi:flagellar FliL protein
MIKKILMGVVAFTILTVAGLQFAGVIHLWGKSKSAATAEAKPELPPVYMSLDPPFVVNFTHRGTLRYLQVSLELMYHDPALLLKVKEHMPAIRNDLILLFSNQDYENLASAGGKENLREEIFKAINHVIGIDGVRDNSVKTVATADKTETVEPSAAPLAPSAPSAPLPTVADPAPTAKSAAPPAPLGEVYITNFVMQ